MIVLLVMGTYTLARSLACRLRPNARATLDNTALQWHYVTCQGIAFALLLQGLPRWLAP